MFGLGSPKYYPAVVEIGAGSLKLLQFEAAKSGPSLARSYYSSRQYSSPGAKWDLRDSLGCMVKETGIKGEAAILLTTDQITSSTYLLPNMPENEIESALVWKIRQNLSPGTTIEDILYDYVRGNPVPGAGSDIYALVFILNRKTALEISELFKEFSLELVCIEPRPYAVIEGLAALNCITERETVLVADIGADNSSLVIVSYGHPYLIRPLTVSGKRFTAALSSYYKIPLDKAELLKREKGLGELRLQETAAGGSNGCFSVLASHLENLVIEIEQTFQYFSHQLLKSKVQVFDRVILTGGGAGLGGLDTFLSERLKVPVSVFDPVRGTAGGILNGIERKSVDNPAVSSGLLGLAAGFMDESSVNRLFRREDRRQ